MQITKEEKKLLDSYANLITEYNKVMNLTGIDQYEQIYLKHYYDAYRVKLLIDELDNIKTIADLGTGMGVPGIVLAILMPTKKVYLIEPMQKRCKFLNIVKDNLELENVYIINERSEDLTDKYDLVVARAVAKLNVLLEISCNIINKNGYLIAMKAKNSEEELIEAKNAREILNYKVVKQDKYIHDDDNSVRNNIVLEKFNTNKTKYPRHFKYIKKEPL